MRLTASDIVALHRPTPCALRVYLRQQGVQESEPSEFDLVLQRLGERHEVEHLASLGPFEDMNAVPAGQRSQRTTEALNKQIPVIYQGELAADTVFDGVQVTIVGRPDFLIWDSDGYLIRDSKLSLRVDEKNHLEIILQLQLYGWLYEQTIGTAAKLLQVNTGRGDIVDVPYDGGVAPLSELSRIVALKRLTIEPYEPLGWSKCGGCGFSGHCHPLAEARKDVSLVIEVDQGLARKLHEDGVETAGQLVRAFDVARLSVLKRPWGDREQKVGKKAEKILMYAEVLATGKERVLGPPAIPAYDNYVMFDLEGMPPHLNELEKIYLWGMQTFGKSSGPFVGVAADFGADGDRKGWEKFLTAAAGIFGEYGNIPFVHWATYEKTHVKQYVDKYGDPDGIAARVLENLLDLLPVTKDAVALPLHSYSLKVIEEYVGFKRKQEEYGGDWAMAKFIEATETENEAARNALMDEILKYNEEDLAATWAVFEWLRGKGALPYDSGGRP